MEIINNSLRSQVMWLVAVCVAVAAAPWLSGGQLPLALLLSGTALLLGGLILWRQPAVRTFRGGPLSWYYLAYVGWGILSLGWSVNRFSTVIWLLPLIFAGLAFRLAYTISGVPEGREAIIRLYLVTAVVFCVYAVWLYLTGGYERLTGSFYWANPSAAYLMPAILIAMHRTLQSSRRVWGPLTVIFATSFLLADSRFGMLVLALVTIAYLALSKLKEVKWTTLVFIGITTIVLTIGATQLRHNLQPHGTTSVPGGRFAEATTGEYKSGTDRLQYLSAAYHIWFSSPLVGRGAGTYGDVHPGYQSTPLNASTSAHNYYAQMLAELGVIGFILLCGILISLPLGLLRGYTEDPNRLVLILGAAALLMHIGLDIDAEYPALMALVGVLFGLVYTQSYRVWIRLSWRVPLAAALVLIPTVSYYLGNSWAIRAAAAQSDNDYPTAAVDYAQATSGLVYNSDWLNAEGINHYAVASSGGGAASTEADIALSLAKAAQHQDPRDGQHHQLEGRVLMLQKHYAEAAAAFERALELDPYDHPAYALDLIYAQTALGEPAKALATAKSMLSNYPLSVATNRATDPTVKPNLADLAAVVGNHYLAAGDLNSAQAAATQALAFDPLSVRARALQHQIDIKR